MTIKKIDFDTWFEIEKIPFWSVIKRFGKKNNDGIGMCNLGLAPSARQLQRDILLLSAPQEIE